MQTVHMAGAARSGSARYRRYEPRVWTRCLQCFASKPLTERSTTDHSTGLKERSAKKIQWADDTDKTAVASIPETTREVARSDKKEDIMRALDRSSTYSFGTGSSGAAARTDAWLLLLQQQMDGEAVEEELQALWNKYDVNKDGALSKSELHRMIKEYGAAAAQHMEHTSPEGTNEAQLAHLKALAGGLVDELTLNRTYDRLDRNGDGKISRSEWMSSVSSGQLLAMRPDEEADVLVQTGGAAVEV